MRKSSERPTGSGTTGEPSPALPVVSPTGLRHGGTGSARLPTTTGGAELTDKGLIAALPPTLRRRVDLTHDRDYDAVTGVSLVNPHTLPVEELVDGLLIAEAAMQPCSGAAIAQHLAACDIATKARDATAVDTKARVHVFAEDLREFPEDVVAEAFRFWRRTEKWQPSVSDIRQRCVRKTRARSSLRFQLQRELARRREPVAEQTSRSVEVTPEEAAAMQEQWVREMAR